MRIAVVSDIHSNSVAFEAVLRDIDNKEIDRIFFLGDYIFGHYHLFMDEEVNGKRFICPSSVGMPFNGDPRAQYVILELQDGIITTTKQYVEYDKLRVVKEFDEKGFFRKYGDWSMKMSTTIFTAHNYID